MCLVFKTMAHSFYTHYVWYNLYMIKQSNLSNIYIIHTKKQVKVIALDAQRMLLAIAQLFKCLSQTLTLIFFFIVSFLIAFVEWCKLAGSYACWKLCWIGQLMIRKNHHLRQVSADHCQHRKTHYISYAANAKMFC